MNPPTKKTLLSLILPLALFAGPLAAVDEAAEPSETTTPVEQQTAHNPGIVAFRGGSWLWSDHLLNIGSNISISVELALEDSIQSTISAEELEREIANIFRKEGISPFATPAPGKPSLPVFHILIMAYPIQDKGYSYSISARLLEAVQLERIRLDPTVTMQAVTWERSSIHIVPKSSFNKDLEESVREVAKQFADRYTFFKNLEKNQR